jgi:3-oxoadipate enol-lactonase
MPYAPTPDGVNLYYEEVGQGIPILFVHEFAGDHRSWESQLREFGKRYRCIAYAARGYKPSDIPDDPSAYSYQHVMRDAVAVLDHLEVERAHLIGLSMGGYTVLQVALNHPPRVRSFVLAGAGSGNDGTRSNSINARVTSQRSSSGRGRLWWLRPTVVVRAGFRLS